MTLLSWTCLPCGMVITFADQATYKGITQRTDKDLPLRVAPVTRCPSCGEHKWSDATARNV